MLEQAREQYARGNLDLPEFEDTVATLLRAGVADVDARASLLEYVPIEHLLAVSRARAKVMNPW